MQDHLKSLALVIVAVLSIFGALAMIALGYTDIDRWWMNPLFWVGTLAVVGAHFASESEMRAMRKRNERERDELLAMIRRSVEPGNH
jgi:hypothetical protein